MLLTEILATSKLPRWKSSQQLVVGWPLRHHLHQFHQSGSTSHVGVMIWATEVIPGDISSSQPHIEGAFPPIHMCSIIWLFRQCPASHSWVHKFCLTEAIDALCSHFHSCDLIIPRQRTDMSKLARQHVRSVANRTPSTHEWCLCQVAGLARRKSIPPKLRTAAHGAPHSFRAWAVTSYFLLSYHGWPQQVTHRTYCLSTASLTDKCAVTS